MPLVTSVVAALQILTPVIVIGLLILTTLAPATSSQQDDSAAKFASLEHSKSHNHLCTARYAELFPVKVILKPGTGKVPDKNSKVSMHYTGLIRDGKVFDCSRTRGTPFSFKLGVGQVIKGWDQAVGKIKVGERAVLGLPSWLAYGDRGAAGVIPPNAELVL